MFGKKVFAAMLATVLGASLFGASAAKAEIDLDDNMGAVTYATETLADSVTGFADYSVVMAPSGGDLLDVTAEIGLGGPSGTFVTVRFTLGGMVFSDTVTGGNLMITGDDSQYGDASLRSGGQVGDDYVSFIVTRTNSTSATDEATLAIDQLGVKPGVPGSVTMRVTDSVGDGAEHTEGYTNAVRTMRALQETPTATNLVATVETRFKSFGTETMGALGSFMVAANEVLLDAANGGTVMLDDIIENDDSSVTISGDFSFTSLAWLQTAAICASGDDLRKIEEDGTVMDELTAQTPSVFAAQQYLCISVPTGDEAGAIPETDAYMVTTEYAAATENAGWPPNAGEHSLGSITRDGTTVHIPFLTTWADYNQRIVISNRGANPAPYWITFRPEEGVTATPNDMYAMGTLDGNSTIVLRAMDVVTLEGRNRTAATFVAEAQSSQIDVATVIVNLVTGSTDTVNYDSD